MPRLSAQDFARLWHLVHELHALLIPLATRVDGRAVWRLTSRESEVLRWLAEGKTNAEIARILATQPRTVDKHCERIYQKLGVENRTAAVRQALDGSVIATARASRAGRGKYRNT